MNRLFDDDDSPGRGYLRDPDRSSQGRDSDREISLGAPAILGIFFALALICAVFFGFGYSVGRKSARAANAAVAASGATAADASGNGLPKPAPGSPASQPAAPAAQPQTASTPAPVAVQAGPAATAAPPVPSGNAATPADGMIVGDKPPSPRMARDNPPASPAIARNGTFMVQVAAVSSQDVANILLASLRRKGYDVVVRHEPQDNLLHVQIGPFATRKDAKAMQQRVLADGFNAIVK